MHHRRRRCALDGASANDDKRCRFAVLRVPRSARLKQLASEQADVCKLRAKTCRCNTVVGKRDRDGV